LVAALGHENLWWRQTAQRLLLEGARARSASKGAEVLQLLAEIVRDGKNDAAAVHALWTMHGLGAFDSPKSEWLDVPKKALRAKSPPVRRAATNVLPRTAESVVAILAARSLSDNDSHVRLDALLALSEMPGSQEAGAALVAILQEPQNATDRWIPLAATAAAARSDLSFLEAAASAKPQAAIIEAVRVAAVHLARRAPGESVGRLLNMVTRSQPTVAEAILAGLASGWPTSRRLSLDAKAEVELKNAAAKLSPTGLLQLAALAQRWGQQAKLGDVTK